jgi:microcompartment protein CcmK/EutM
MVRYSTRNDEGARQVFAFKDAPVRSVIVGIIDAVAAS